MSFPRKSAFGQEEDLQIVGAASAQAKLATVIGETIQSAARSPHIAENTARIRELIDEMVKEAAEDTPDQERFEALAEEAREVIDGTDNS